MQRYCSSLLIALLLASLAQAQSISALKIETGRADAKAADGFLLSGRDSWQQLLVTATDANGKPIDVTRQAKYSASPVDVVAITPDGLVTPLKEGKATLTAQHAGQSATVTAHVKHIEQEQPINFSNEIVPIFTKFGCNAGGCHGKASGQNGFKLSLLGFEPEEDHEYLVKEARGRRLFPASPENSLLLRKAVGQAPHGGGKKLDTSSPFYRVLVRWVAQGSPYGAKSDPTVTEIEVLPGTRILARESSQQLVVIAKLSDGSTRDVTRMTSFECNQADLADVSETGLVTTKKVPGQVSVMARFQSHVSVFRGTIPLGAKVDSLPPVRTFVDDYVFKQLKQLGLPPSATADDSTFIRRLTIDLTGRLPTKKEVEDFVADKEQTKYEKLVDRLLTSTDYADYFTNKWGAMLRNRRASTQDSPQPTAAFHAWIKKNIHENTPYDRFVREVLTATGEEIKTPAVVWFRELREPESQMEDAAQLFLGQRIGCAKCHHHPLEKWSQEDYYGMTAFFKPVKVKLPPPPKNKGKNKKKKDDKPEEEEVRVATVSLDGKTAEAINPRTKKTVKPTGLGSGKPMSVAKGEDPRAKLVDWMVEKDNPFFAKTLVNRYWKHFMGRGLVDPEDDMRVTNPPSNPELLDALAKSFTDSKYDMKKLIRTICLSSAYRLSAVPNEHNASDRQNYSRFIPKRLHAEVLLDAIDLVTQSKTAFKGAPSGVTRAVQLPDNLFDSYFLSVFGRPDAASACECERSSDSSLAQCLHMMNSQEILGKVSGPRAKALASDKRPHAERIKELYQIALARDPSKDETAALLAHIEKKGASSAASAYEDIIWALINTKEFLFNH